MSDIPVPQTPRGFPLYDTLMALETVTDLTARDALHLWLSWQCFAASPQLQAAEPALYAVARTAFFRHVGDVVQTLLTPTETDADRAPAYSPPAESSAGLHSDSLPSARRN